MRHVQRILIAGLVSSITAWSSAHAECSEDQRLRIRRELETTDARIEQAAEIVGASPIEPARMELRAARESQDRARGEFSARRCRGALDLTMRARFHAARAIEISRGQGPPPGPAGPPGLPDPRRVMIQTERTRELLERARDPIGECDDDRARAALREAFALQRRAEEALAQGRPLAAFQLTVSAREGGLRALRICHVEEDVHESADRALRRTDEILSRARDVVAERGRARARKPLQRAIALQERAWAEFRAEHVEASLRLTQAARSLALGLLRGPGGTP